MKKIYFSAIIILMTSQLVAQTNASDTPYDLNIEVGAYYAFEIGGFGINAVVFSPDKKWSYALRNRFLFNFEKGLNTSTGQYSPYYVVSRYYTQNYLDVHYCWNVVKKHRFETGLGIGWTYNGEKENYRLNKGYGFYVLSASVMYRVTWFYLELRGDYPLLSQKDRAIGPDRVFPVSLGLYYRFKPGK